MRLPKYAQLGGFAMLVIIFAIALLMVFVLTGFTRISGQMTSVSRQADIRRAFQMAEAGLDDQIAQLSSVTTSQQISNLLALPLTTVSLPGDAYSSYAYQFVDAGDQNSSDVLVRITGTYWNTAQHLEAAIRLPASGVNPLFNYAVAGLAITLSGNAAIGNALNNQSKLFAQGLTNNTASVATSGANNVWASEVDFYNPTNQPLATLCPNCGNGSIFHTPITYKMDAPSLPSLLLDLRPYYNEAVTEGHVITSNVTYADQTLSGVYYVECGISVTFKGVSTLRGTLVHEGCNGSIKIASNGSLTIDSISGTQFANGAAILGAPNIQFGNTTTINLRGIVMHKGSASLFSATGNITGSLIGINPDSFATNYPDLISGPGPGNYPYLVFPLEQVYIGGSTNVVFQPLTAPIPGVQTSPGSAHLLYWHRL